MASNVLHLTSMLPSAVHQLKVSYPLLPTVNLLPWPDKIICSVSSKPGQKKKLIIFFLMLDSQVINFFQCIFQRGLKTLYPLGFPFKAQGVFH